MVLELNSANELDLLPTINAEKGIEVVLSLMLQETLGTNDRICQITAKEEK